jgi:outer membrane protein TolC
VLFGFTIPIFDWAASANAGRALSLQAEQLRVEGELARRSHARAYGSALERVTALHELIGIAQTQVGLSEQNLKLARVRYEGGEGSALDVVSAQEQLAQARASYYQAVAGHLQARADLAIAGGR